MVEPRYGFLREVEYDFLDLLIERIGNRTGSISFLEIGVQAAGTVRGVVRRCRELSIPIMAAGVDFEQYKPNPLPECPYTFYRGDSMDAWRKIKHQFNFLFIDGCHCVNHTMMDFLNYSPFVTPNGYCLFHDTALPIGGKHQEEFPQNHSYAGQPDSVLGVREGLDKLGLLTGYRTDWIFISEIRSDTGLMGMMLFQKLL